MKYILITGAAGILGSRIINALDEDLYCIYALDLQKDRMMTKFTSRKNISFYESSEITAISWDKIDLVIHCAFARQLNGVSLSQSVDFTRQIFKFAVRNNIKKVINISSQSIYGLNRNISSTEDSIINPSDLYAMAKYACEQLGREISQNGATEISHLRLGSLIGPQFSERIVSKMIKDAYENSAINIIGGKQVFSFFDVRDAVSGICKMIENMEMPWKTIYNLGSSEQYNIIELGQTIVDLFEKNNKKINIILRVDDNIKMQIRLNSSLFSKDFNWRAKYTLRDTVKYIYEELYEK